MQGDGRFYVETLGCPKNQVDSEKIVGTLLTDGLVPTDDAFDADVVVVNTCAFIEEARKESIEVILQLNEARRSSSRLVVTGCMAERYGDELAAELPEVDAVVGFGGAITERQQRRLIPVAEAPMPTMDLLNLHRPPAERPWSYVKVAEVAIARAGFVPYRHSVGASAAMIPHQSWKRSVRCRHKKLFSWLRISHRTG